MAFGILFFFLVTTVVCQYEVYLSPGSYGVGEVKLPEEVSQNETSMQTIIKSLMMSTSDGTQKELSVPSISQNQGKPIFENTTTKLSSMSHHSECFNDTQDIIAQQQTKLEQIESSLRQIYNIVKEQKILTTSHQPLCATQDQMETFQDIIKTDKQELLNSISECSKKYQIADIESMLKLGEDSSFFSMASHHSKKITLIAPSILQLKELEDASLNKQTYSDSVYRSKYKSNYGNDGDDDTLFISKKTLHPWWMVDLGEERKIYHISILPRQDCCHDRYHDVEIRIGNTLQIHGDFSSYTLLYFYKGPYTLEEGTLVYTFLTGITGRYLSIQIKSDNRQFLQIATIKAMAVKKHY